MELMVPIERLASLLRSAPFPSFDYLELLKMFSLQKHLFQYPGLAWISNGCLPPVAGAEGVHLSRHSCVC